MRSNRTHTRGFLAAVATLCAAFAIADRASAQVNVWHVDATAPPGGNGVLWTTAFDNLQLALDAAEASAEFDLIRLAKGEYVPVAGVSDPRTGTFLINFANVTIEGGYAGLSVPGNEDDRDVALYETILNGDLGALPEGGPPDACVVPDPMAGDCLQETLGVPGCTNSDCCSLICAMPGFGICCEIQWYQFCADEALLHPECFSPPTFTEVYHVVTIQNVDATVRLDGVSITGGRANGRICSTNVAVAY